MTIRAIIVDDERAVVGHLSDLLEESGVVEIAGAYTNPLEALKALEARKDSPVHVAFLDIEMPGMHGMELANRVMDVSGDTRVVFVTAYSEYAIEAFELNATDYVMKPVSMERLHITLDRIVSMRSSTDGGTGLSVKCFGKFRVLNEQGEPIKWRTNKTEELFDRNGKEVGKAKLIDELWSGLDVKRALTHFNTSLYNLRKVLRELGLSHLLCCTDGMYRLDTDAIGSDFHRFEHCISHWEHIGEDSLSRFEEAIDQCEEGYMELNYYEWAEDKRRQLDIKYTELVERVVAYCRSRHMPHKALELLKKGLMRDAFHPRLNREAMELYIELNDPYAAWKHYMEYKRRLAEELGMEPDQAVEQLRKSLDLTN